MRELAGIALLLAAAAAAHGGVPSVLDWDTELWPAGSLGQTYTIGGGDVVLAFGGDTAYFQPLGTGQTPNVSAVLTGGLIPVQSSLHMRTNYPSGALDYVTLTIDFTHTGGVTDLSFTIFDIDALFFNHTDQVEAQGYQGATAINPTAVTTNACSTFDGTRTVTGTCLSGNTSNAGNAAFTFGQSGITRVVITYRNTTFLSNPGVQEISLHDLGFAEPATITKRAYDITGAPIADGANLAAGTRVKFLLYVNNPGKAETDASIRDTLDAAFNYVGGSITYDNSVASCAAPTCTAVEEAAIFAAADGGAGASDLVDGDVASYIAPNVDAGNQYETNAQLDIAGASVWAVVFTVVIR